MIFPVTLSYDPWAKWSVNTTEYDAEWTGDGWRGSHIESAQTQEEALQNYRDYLYGEGNDDIILEILGPSIALEHKKHYI